MIIERDMTMSALVQPLETQQVGGWSQRGCRSSSQPTDIGGVVGACPDCSFTDVKGGCNDIAVGNVAAQFQVAVIDSAIWVVPIVERASPEE